jgi:hypothetical protein
MVSDEAANLSTPLPLFDQNYCMVLRAYYFHRMGSDKAQNELLAVDLEKGVIVQNFLLDVPLLGDWESLTRGPCSSTKKKTCLYIGNMGNNHANSCINTECTFGNAVVYVYKLEEPIIGGDYRGTAIKVATMQISFKGSNFPTNRANSESLFVVR